MVDGAWILLLLIIVGISAYYVWPYYRLRQVMAAPFPSEWRAIIRRNVPTYRYLPTDLQHQLQRLVKQFIYQKEFTGCNGLVITDEIKVTIAASACLLLLNRKTDVFGGLRYILVYPSAFSVPRESADEAGLHQSYPAHLLGESWANGKVILSWEDVLKGNQDRHDGMNLVLHEFAHQLDSEAGANNGAPVLGSKKRYQRWATVFQREFEALRQAAFQGDETLLDYYGATNPAEFFAVVTEVFFEQPQAMQQRHPELFGELKHYYKVDPREWD
ncbi:zinc-dependent peptidase [Thiofilum flexile]|uniref:M90 family metallopeptidase n=1 Tax=Thiofilum flexile TaxID=125627 RepID=UPI00035F4D27|nr:M90 family metallopeptidase [Thiofilum flexile]